MSFFSRFKALDAYPKTLDDFRVRTFSGAIVSVVSTVFILWLFFSEVALYMSTEVQPELFVDTTRGERLRINVDIIFHKLPCAFLSLDAMDISGEHQLDVSHNIMKKRLSPEGVPLITAPPIKDDVNKKKLASATAGAENGAAYCGSCYGAEGHPGHCCNTCEEVRDAYLKKGWGLNLEGIEQCAREGFTEALMEQKGEGCEVYGFLLVNKVAGNFHFAPGKSFQQHSMHVHDLQPFKDIGDFNMSHSVVRLSFGNEFPGIINPLDGVAKIEKDESGMFQYFIKVVPTIYESIAGELISTNQFSVTEHYRALPKSDHGGGQGHGPHSHGLPGLFFMYDLSPIMVKFTEKQRSLAHFLTGVCAIVGGVFTVAGIIDSFIYHSMRSIKKKIELGKAS
eukprot:TRINITY_DN1565_c0_g1_i4.p1 TRINITY_DN1565_c0_g1~~TRINITY_DN1565_c0_g1_i4.p1  ORF type:complete len:395 (+),score=132.82 TRINITY_DN1565_c0_g1_i4:137-1321(+)